MTRRVSVSEQPSLGKTRAGPLTIDLPRLIETRLLIQGQSGSGKSYAVRRLLEQTHGHVQQLVLDVDDEYASLRERFEVVLGGPGRDFPVEVRSAAQLARRLLELGVSAVLNLSDLRMDAQYQFAARFLEGLIAAPREAHRGALVVVEEVQRLAPQGGGDADCTRAVIDLMQRGRKRGLGGLAVCQRISDVHKSVVSLAQNRLIGVTTMDLDVQRAAGELGFKGADGARRLRALASGHFYAFGPALSREVVEVAIGPAVTTHGGALGGAQAPPPAPPNVRALLAKLTDLPAEAVPEAAHEGANGELVEALRARVLDLEAELERGPELARELAKARALALFEERDAVLLEQLEAVRTSVGEALARALGPIVETMSVVPDLPEIVATSPAAARKLSEIAAEVNTETRRMVAAEATRTRSGETRPKQSTADPIGPVHQRILDALASLRSAGIDAPARVQVSLLCRYRNARSGGFSEPLGRLFDEDLLDYPAPGRVRLTPEGIRRANFPARPPTSRDLQQMILSALSGPEQKLLGALLLSHPRERTREDLARELKYENPRSGGFSQPLGHLKELGLVTYPSRGTIRVADLLFIRRL